MQTLSRYRGTQPSSLPSAPLYVRWDPEKGPFAIELKLDAVAAITAEIERLGDADVEIGGILIGTLPTEENNVLRINDVQIIPRAAGDQRVFILDPRERDRFVLARWEAGNKGRVPVGFFRTHLRGGPMRPSLADRTLLAGEFDSSAYVLLLIGSAQPRIASFFAGSRGELSEQPSVSPFRLEAAELRRLPEGEPESESTARSDSSPAASSGLRTAISGATDLPAPTPLPRHPKSTYVATALLFFTVIAAAYAWSDLPNRGLLGFAAAADPGLSVAGDRVLHISWNHSAPSVTAAASAKLSITERDSRRELQISAGELHAGAIEYQSASPVVQVTLTLEMANVSLSQTALWRR